MQFLPFHSLIFMCNVITHEIVCSNITRAPRINKYDGYRDPLSEYLLNNIIVNTTHLLNYILSFGAL